jgi:hypothetical protein
MAGLLTGEKTGNRLYFRTSILKPYCRALTQD